MKAEFKIICKTDMVMSYVSHYCLKKFIASKNNTEFKKDKKMRIYERALGGMKKAMDSFMGKWEKEMGPDIRKGKVDMDTDFFDKGGVVTFKLQGTKDEIDTWTKIGIKDKVALRGLTRWVEIEVIK